MITITDEMMLDRISKTKYYTLVILRAGKNKSMEGADRIIWEHGRRNFVLREEGKLSIVCPINDGSDCSGIGIFSTNLEETKKIMDEDEGVKQGIFIYEMHECRSFPGDKLP